jgi:hypothetical protein
VHPIQYPKSATTETDMWDPLLHRACSSNTHRETERERERRPSSSSDAGEIEEMAGATDFGLGQRTTAVGGPTGFTAARCVYTRLQRGPRWPVASWPWMQAAIAVAISDRRAPVAVGRGEGQREHPHVRPHPWVHSDLLEVVNDGLATHGKGGAKRLRHSA